MGRVGLIDVLAQDIRIAIRLLWKHSEFAFVAVPMLALGMCATVAIFAFVDATLIKLLPYDAPSQLVGVFGEVPKCPRCSLSYLDYIDLKKLNHVFSSFDVYNRSDAILRTADGAENVGVTGVSDGFFNTLGINPMLGRNFYSGENLPAATRTVLITYTTWQKRYGGKQDVMGETVTLDDIPYTIIGVLPRNFHFGPAEPTEFWAAIHADHYCYQSRGCHRLLGVARLKNGIPLQAALSDLTSIMSNLESQYPDTNREKRAVVAPLTEVIIGNFGPILRMLLVGTILLLLITVVNIAGLLIVRAEGRRQEMAIRNALGVPAGRLISQFVTEGVVLVAAGTLVGLVLAYFTVRLFKTFIPAARLAEMPYLNDLGLNLHVLAYALLISLLTVVLFSVIPLTRLPFSAIREGITTGSRGSAAAWRRIGSRLVVLEMAIALVLLVGAGLLCKSFYRLLNVETGFQQDHLVTLSLTVPQSDYATDAQLISLQRQIRSQIETLPGVKSAGLAKLLPVGSNNSTRKVRVLGRPYNGEHNEVLERQVSSTYFSTLGARLIRGRYFAEIEDTSMPRVVIINQAFVKEYFPGEDPIGKQLSFLGNLPVPMEIVGIVEDIKEGPLSAPTLPATYLPLNQNERNYFSVIVRTFPQAERSLLPMLTNTIHQIDRGIAVASVVTMSEIINNSQTAYLHQVSAYLAGGFAVLALILSIVGVYGVIAYSVSQRTREIGVRIALGADHRSICNMVLKESGRVIAIGILIGLVCSVAAAELIRGLLFGVGTLDLPILTIVTGLLAGSALLASYIPARRAAALNPVEALHVE